MSVGFRAGSAGTGLVEPLGSRARLLGTEGAGWIGISTAAAVPARNGPRGVSILASVRQFAGLRFGRQGRDARPCQAGSAATCPLEAVKD